MIVAYLADLKLPADGYTCPALPISFAQQASAAREQQVDQWDLWREDVMRVR